MASDIVRYPADNNQLQWPRQCKRHHLQLEDPDFEIRFKQDHPMPSDFVRCPADNNQLQWPRHCKKHYLQLEDPDFKIRFKQDHPMPSDFVRYTADNNQLQWPGHCKGIIFNQKILIIKADLNRVIRCPLILSATRRTIISCNGRAIAKASSSIGIS